MAYFYRPELLSKRPTLALPRITATVYLVAALTGAKLIVAANTPLAFDEALYWRYSQHLAAGYIDHPFLNPLLIRIGTTLFGDTPLGVRFMAVLLSLPASWSVWRAAKDLFGSDLIAETATWYFNLTIVMTLGSMVATSDQVVVTTTCILLACLARLQRTGRGEWWLAVGCTFGIGMCAKYTTLFFAPGVLIWLLATPSQRRWLSTPWPWLAGGTAALVFAPVLSWNAGHGWASFVYQSGRLTVFHWTARYLVELSGSMALLATPPILVMAVAGLFSPDPREAIQDARRLLLALIAPMLLFFAWYATHKRVQGNWIERAFPIASVAAAYAAHSARAFGAKLNVLIGWSAKIATPFGLVMAFVMYAEAVTGFLPLGRHDPRVRVLAVGWTEVATELQDARNAMGAKAVITTDYPLNSWIRFFLPRSIPVEQIDDRMRWSNEPPPPDAIFDSTAMYVCRSPCPKLWKVQDRFRNVDLLETIKQDPAGIAGGRYRVYRATGRMKSILDYRLYGADHRDD